MPRKVRRWLYRKLVPYEFRYKIETAGVRRKESKEIAAAKTPEDRDAAQHYYSADWIALYDEREQRASDRLVRQAHKLRVPVPGNNRRTRESEEGSPWEYSDYTEDWFLTRQGYSDLRKAIWEERGNRRESRLAWLAVIGTLTGLGGVLIALLEAIAKTAK